MQGPTRSFLQKKRVQHLLIGLELGRRLKICNQLSESRGEWRSVVSLCIQLFHSYTLCLWHYTLHRYFLSADLALSPADALSLSPPSTAIAVNAFGNAARFRRRLPLLQVGKDKKVLPPFLPFPPFPPPRLLLHHLPPCRNLRHDFLSCLSLPLSLSSRLPMRSCPGRLPWTLLVAKSDSEIEEVRRWWKFAWSPQISRVCGRSDRVRVSWSTRGFEEHLVPFWSWRSSQVWLIFVLILGKNSARLLDFDNWISDFVIYVLGFVMWLYIDSVGADSMIRNTHEMCESPICWIIRDSYCVNGMISHWKEKHWLYTCNYVFDSRLWCDNLVFVCCMS